VAVYGLLLVAVLLWLRRWPEATWVAPNVAILVCSTTLISTPRYALLWFSTYLLLAQVAARPRWTWLAPALVVLAVPLLALVTLSFTTHQWTA